jgi:uncharacterized DUF497 family protein
MQSERLPLNAFEWNDRKSETNRKNHGIDFSDAAQIFLGRTVERPDDRFHYDELRTIALGEVKGQVLVVVYTMREDTCRIISARRANKHEREYYYQVLFGRTPRPGG